MVVCKYNGEMLLVFLQASSSIQSFQFHKNMCCFVEMFWGSGLMLIDIYIQMHNFHIYIYLWTTFQNQVSSFQDAYENKSEMLPIVCSNILQPFDPPIL